MPKAKVQVTMNVTVMLDVDGKTPQGYYAMRQMFGKSRGRVSEMLDSAHDVHRYDEHIGDIVRNWASKADAHINWSESVTATPVNITFPKPVIRPLEDVITAPAATAGSEYDED